MQPEHRQELDRYKRSPLLKVVYALGMLSDIADGNMVGEDRDIHISDAKEIIGEQIKLLPDDNHIRVRQEQIKVGGHDYFVTHIPTATSGYWFVIHDVFEMWAAVAIDINGEVIGWRNPPDDKYKTELEEAAKKAFGIPEQP